MSSIVEDDDDGGFKPRVESSVLNEHSSLAMNKMSGSRNSLNSNRCISQLPILNINTLGANASGDDQVVSNSGNTPPGSGANITLSSTTLSNRIIDENNKKFKNLNDYTTSAHEFLTQSISQNQLNHIDSVHGSTKNLNSPSNNYLPRSSSFKTTLERMKANLTCSAQLSLVISCDRN
jgi:hypothetical protein